MFNTFVLAFVFEQRFSFSLKEISFLSFIWFPKQKFCDADEFHDNENVKSLRMVENSQAISHPQGTVFNFIGTVRPYSD